jgi:hypothetical protein
MTRKYRGHYAKKHPPGRVVKPQAAEALSKRAKDGKISCAAAFEVVKELDIPPDEVGFSLDSLEIRIIKCQMGIFGYDHGRSPVTPLDVVLEEFKSAIEAALIAGRLPCKSAWEIAERLGTGKMDVTAACENLKIRVSSCQLGAF